MNKSGFHHRRGAAVPLHRHRAIAVVFKVGLHIVVVGVAYGDAVEDFTEGIGNGVDHFVGAGAQAAGYAENAHAALGNTGCHWVGGDIARLRRVAHTHFTHKRNRAPPAVGHGGLVARGCDTLGIDFGGRAYGVTAADPRLHYPGVVNPVAMVHHALVARRI